MRSAEAIEERLCIGKIGRDVYEQLRQNDIEKPRNSASKFAHAAYYGPFLKSRVLMEERSDGGELRVFIRL